MTWFESHLLSLIIFFPALSAVVLLAAPLSIKGLRRLTVILTLAELISSIFILQKFQLGTPDLQLVEKASWIPSFGIQYFVAIDGISIWLVLLTTFLTFVVSLTSFSISERVRAYAAALMLLETAMIGTFTAMDLFLFYVFWESVLIPMALLIGVWGGPRRIYAAIKFFLYTMAGSVFMLIGIITLVLMHREQFGSISTNLLDLYRVMTPAGTGFFQLQTWLFLAFGIAFAIKVPLVPFHTWLPDAHVEAPTGGSVLLAGVLLKMGTYGFVRLAVPLFPVGFQQLFPILVTLALVGIIYGALVSFAQSDLKKLVAYSSVSHLGYVMLGILTQDELALGGGILQMVNHGLSTGGLFLIVGMLYDRRHTRLMADFGGIATKMPVLATFFMILTLSSIGLPATNGFVGEFLILLGAFRQNWVLSALATVGIVLGAVYMLRMFQRVMFGPIKHPENQLLSDIGGREKFMLVLIAIIIFWIGLYPKFFLEKTEASVKHYISDWKDYTLETAP